MYRVHPGTSKDGVLANTPARTVAPWAGAGDGARWWAAVQDQTETPIAKLVDGFAEIGEHQIPYGWLPVRAHSAYGAEFTVWSELGTETLSTLFARPYAGEATVRALLLVARERVARGRSAKQIAKMSLPSLLSRFIERFDDYDRAVLSARGWALRPRSIEEVATHLGVAKVNIHRNEPRTHQRFQDLLAEPWHAPIVEAAEQLRGCLGALTREATAAKAVDKLGVDLGSDAGQIILHLAGPYRCTEPWLEVAGTLTAAEAALDGELGRDCAPTLAQLMQTFGKTGIAASAAVEFIEQQPDLRRFDEQWVRWGPGVGDRAAAALHLAGAPRGLECIASVVGVPPAGRKRVYIRDVLNSDPRFTRTTRATWGLSRWGVHEYAGIYGEIGALIDAAGGTISTAEVVAGVIAAVPDVTAASVRKFMGAPGYVVKNGMVRRRTAADTWPKPAPPSSARSTFHNGRQLRIALDVDADMLRGSGVPLPQAVAFAVGVAPGDRKVFTNATEDVLVLWRLSSNRGPTFGSLRRIARSLGAVEGDTLVLGFDRADSRIGASRIAAAAEPAQRIAGLLGRRVRDRRAAMARALRCAPEEVADILTRRGDADLVELLD